MTIKIVGGILTVLCLGGLQFGTPWWLLCATLTVFAWFIYLSTRWVIHDITRPSLLDYCPECGAYREHHCTWEHAWLVRGFRGELTDFDAETSARVWERIARER